MERPKRWHYLVILFVTLLTLYNILPTIFYYSNPLNSPIDQKRADRIAHQIAKRINRLEDESIQWLWSFTKLIQTKPQSISLDKKDPQLITVAFSDPKEAKRFKHFLPRAGNSIFFVPAQLNLVQGDTDQDSTVVKVKRKIGIHFDEENIKNIFTFSEKFDSNQVPTETYKKVIFGRASNIIESLAGTSQIAKKVQLITLLQGKAAKEMSVSLARNIVGISNILGVDHPITKRYFASFTQIQSENKEQLVRDLQKQMEKQVQAIQKEIANLKDDEKQKKSLLQAQNKTLKQAISILKSHNKLFASGKSPFLPKEILSILENKGENISTDNLVQTLDFEGRNPFIQSLSIDWDADTIKLSPYNDVQTILSNEAKTENQALQKEKVNQLISNAIAFTSRETDEEITPFIDVYNIKLNTLNGSTSFLAMKLEQIANEESRQIIDEIKHSWNPKHIDLIKDNYPIYNYEKYQTLSPAEKNFALFVYAPIKGDNPAFEGFQKNSIYVIAKGLKSIVDQLDTQPESEISKQAFNDINNLFKIMRLNGYIPLTVVPKAFKNDIIFEYSNYYNNLLAASREDFIVKGDHRFAILEFSNVEQRILAENRIEDAIQEDLIKWKEAYQKAQVNPNPVERYAIATPTKNVYIENLKLAFRKYFRGDERKILKWGLDLSGGKTVRIGLRDKDMRPVKDPEDLKQAVNELYTRINKLGVSERTIRIEGDTIVIDFPGSQGISAKELIKASAMYFHVVNEKFTPQNKNRDLASVANEFLQEVWNEAVVTKRTDVEGVNEIAWKKMGGNPDKDGPSLPLTENARILYENGLRIANPYKEKATNHLDDTFSKIAIYKGEDFTDWNGQTHPLTVVFHNFVMEGASLINVRPGYDPSKGHMLLFDVKGDAQNAFYTWSSHFSEEKIVNTPLEKITGGRGFRMAVIFNGKIISSPSLAATLRTGGMITGNFTPSQINKLIADLKAGSLSFTPYILSEQNVSPELGKEERTSGIIASLVGLSLVAIAMIGYYHFAGIVATVAVFFNLLIMWGILQNLGAALTLPGIAGIVLTIGMAVDANVLVFERIREEFSISGRIASAIAAGYRKAFSAIVDSNVTTIIAALILIQFDSGPIKGFALVLIIGILSSMFTALFMTRTFFAWWIQNPGNETLTMSQWIGNTKINFLKWARPVMILSLLLIIGGGYLLYEQRRTIFGMDFTGGYSLAVDLNQNPNENLRLKTHEALVKAGAPASAVEVRELGKANRLRIQLGIGMEDQGNPFFGMPQELSEKTFAYPYESNPRINWVVQALKNNGLEIQQSDLANLHKNWNVMSGQFSDTMRNNAIFGLSLALIAILIYITLRFEFKYAIASVIALAHDILITLGIIAFFHKLGFLVQIDLQAIGAIMTIIGYSLNDTIIVFDRIREDIKIMRKAPFADIINHALNITLSRTLMTSGTTLLVLLALVLLGGPTIFGFAFVMTVGVVVGTISSLFVASPIMLYFHNREKEADKKALYTKS